MKKIKPLLLSQLQIIERKDIKSNEVKTYPKYKSHVSMCPSRE